MAIKKIEMREKGTGNYADILYPKTSVDQVEGLSDALDAKAPLNHTHTYSSLTGIPSTFTPSAHTQAISTITGLQAALDGKASTAVVTTTVNGLMSASDKVKLDGIAANANNYVHPTTAGNQHIPAGGSLGTYLGWESNGTAQWRAIQGTDVTAASTTVRGTVQLSSATNSTSTTLAATASAVKAAYDLAAGKANATHTHDMADVTGLPAALTAAENNAKAYADTKVAALVDSSPEALDTLKELANALGNDPNFATTVATQIGTKLNTSTFNTHANDAVIHVTAADRTRWDSAAGGNHTHSYTEITGLTTELNKKLNTAGGTVTGNLQVNGTLKNDGHFKFGAITEGVTGVGDVTLGLIESSQLTTTTRKVDFRADQNNFTTGTLNIQSTMQVSGNAYFSGTTEISTLLTGGFNVGTKLKNLTIPVSATQPTNGEDLWYKVVA